MRQEAACGGRRKARAQSSKPHKPQPVRLPQAPCPRILVPPQHSARPTSIRSMTKPNTLSGDITLELPEFDAPPTSPLTLNHEWIQRAEALGVRELGAATLATIGEDGPSTRTVLVKDVTPSFLVFTTSALSRKGRELDADPRCALNFYWRETMQQISIKGRAEKASKQESDARFAARPEAARATVIASQQSRELRDEAALKRRAEAIQMKGELARPDDWHAWHVVPYEVEFWHGRTDRLHRRLCYWATKDGKWEASRLEP